MLQVLANEGQELQSMLESFLGLWWGPLLGALAAAGAVLGVAAGLKYLFAVREGDEQKIKAAKKFVIGIIVSIIIIFLIAVGVPLLIAMLSTWRDSQASIMLNII